LIRDERSNVVKTLLFVTLIVLLLVSGCAKQSPEASLAKTNGATAEPVPSPVHYTVPGTVPVIAQTKHMDCWAVTTAILVSWKENRLVPTKDLVARLSGDLGVIYDTDAGLFQADQGKLITQVHLRQEAPQNYSVPGWLSLLKNNGALWVTTAFPLPGKKWGLHARVVSAINGDGTPDGTTLHIIDPDGGKVSDQTVSAFTKEMENVAKADEATDIRPLVIHH
jgi:hypothetical protein